MTKILLTNFHKPDRDVKVIHCDCFEIEASAFKSDQELRQHYGHKCVDCGKKTEITLVKAEPVKLMGDPFKGLEWLGI